MAAMNPPINVLIADGRKLFREGLFLVLERQAGIKVIGEAEDARDVPRLLSSLSINVVILDLSPARSSDFEMVRAIVRASQSARVIVLSHTPTIEYVQDLIKAGASGCLSRESAGAELVAAVEKVNRQGVYLSTALADRVVSRHVQPAAAKQLKRALASREREVLRRIAAGQCTREIALAMGVSSKTIETHRRRIMQKLDRHSVAELTKYALANGLATLEAAI